MSDWINWESGENPVPWKIVEVKFKDGNTNEGDSEDWYWKHIGGIGDIIAYRVIEDEGQKIMNYKHEDFTKIVDSTIVEMRKLIELKGGEYAGDVDRLANFRRNGERLVLPMEVIWGVYAAKHIDAVFQYIQDIQTGKKRERIEPITGRIDDIIVYMLLLKAIVDERERE